MPPPTIRQSSRRSRLRRTPILVLILAPPMIAAKGRAGFVSAFSR